jgi:hypothetical protein
VINWYLPIRRQDEETAQDAARLYDEMWSLDGMAGLFGYGRDAMRRLLRGRAALRRASTVRRGRK